MRSNRPKHRRSTCGRARHAVLGAFLAIASILGSYAAHAAEDDVEVAMSLADLLRGARTVISANQSKINDANLGDKGLGGDVVVKSAIANTMKASATDPGKVDPASRKGRLLAAMTAAIEEVMTASQDLINQRGVGFKGFVPAVFGRLVTEQFKIDAKGEAEIKVTAPPELVRNRKASPDELETEVIRTKFLAADWPKGQIYSLSTTVKGRSATRVLVPENYGAACLSCHGDPKGEIDITGYPKEGAKQGDLGGVISITLYR